MYAYRISKKYAKEGECVMEKDVVVRKKFIALLEKICQDLKIREPEKIIKEYCKKIKNEKLM